MGKTIHSINSFSKNITLGVDESPTEVWKGVDLDSELLERSNESSRRKKIQLRELLATSVETRMRVPPNTAVLRPTKSGEISRVRTVSEPLSRRKVLASSWSWEV